MTRQDSGWNLLFGVIALQLDLIDSRRFAEACSAWAARKDVSLGDLLLERGWITTADRAEIEGVLRRKLDRHGGDARRSLDAAVDHGVGSLVSSVIMAEDRDLGFATGVAAPDPPGPTVDAPTAGPAPGTRGRYRLVRMYARGGLGQVWLARDPVLGREVALKELRPERAADPTSRARFLREARISGRLEHPGIVTVHELAGEGGDRRAFYAMQLVRGRTLREAVRDYHERFGGCPGGALELHTLLDDFVAVCNAIAYAHSRGVIHRDLKGQNIVLGDFGEVVVLDWGLAKVVGQAEAPADGEAPAVESPDERGEGLTLEGQRLGTPGFIAPELAEGRHELVGIASDIYGLGAILYEILTGEPPFADSGVTEALKRVTLEDPVPPRRICPDIPCALESICLKALSKRPEDRYATASAMAQDVRRWLADEPVSAYREPASEKLGRWGRRHRSAAVTGAVLLAAMAAGLVVVVLAIGRERAKTREALASEASHRRRAGVNLALAIEAVDDLYAKALDGPLLAGPGMDPLRLAMIRSTHELYLKLVILAPEDSDLREHLAGSYLMLSGVARRAGESERAAGQIRGALEIFEALAAAHPERERYRRGIARCRRELAECGRDGPPPTPPRPSTSGGPT